MITHVAVKQIYTGFTFGVLEKWWFAAGVIKALLCATRAGILFKVYAWVNNNGSITMRSSSASLDKIDMN